MATSMATTDSLPNAISLTAKISRRQVAVFDLPARSYEPTCTAETGSGSQVFGESGAKNVSLVKLWNQLKELGYRISFASLQQRANDTDGRRTLMVAFERFGEQGIEERLHSLIRDFLISPTWLYAHVWQNPPKEGGIRIDTISLAGRRETDARHDLNLPWRLIDL